MVACTVHLVFVIWRLNANIKKIIATDVCYVTFGIIHSLSYALCHRPRLDPGSPATFQCSAGPPFASLFPPLSPSSLPPSPLFLSPSLRAVPKHCSSLHRGAVFLSTVVDVFCDSILPTLPIPLRPGVCAAFTQCIVQQSKATATNQVEGHCDKHNLSAAHEQEDMKINPQTPPLHPRVFRHQRLGGGGQGCFCRVPPAR